jgi:hypothetical protein
MDDATRQALVEKIGFFLNHKRTAHHSTMLFIGFFDPQICSWSVYEDQVKQVSYVDLSYDDLDTFCEGLVDIWKAQPRKHQWQTLEAILEGEEIKLYFFYADKPLGPREDLPPREPIIRKYFGDKTVYYPPLPHKGPEDLGFEL